MKTGLFIAALLATLWLQDVRAQRQSILLNDNWHFRFSHQVDKNSGQRVDIPHTWNAQDALSGKPDYKRGIGNYEKKLMSPSEWEGKRLYLRFEGANNVTDLFVNGKHIGQHKGGYGAFVFEITDNVAYGKVNSILARVNNAENLEIMPLVGDFNFYGGIYRDVRLIVAGPVGISLLDHGSCGIRLVQENVNENTATVKALVQLSNSTGTVREAELKVRVLDGDRQVLETSAAVSVQPEDNDTKELSFKITDPHLWNGTEDPFIYRAEISLWSGGELIDKVVQPLGLRYYHIDPDKGFFLNGKHLQLRGVCRHQDRPEIGNALRPEHHEEDAAIMAEMGVFRRPGRIRGQRICGSGCLQGERKATACRTHTPALQPSVDLPLGHFQ